MKKHEHHAADTNRNQTGRQLGDFCEQAPARGATHAVLADRKNNSGSAAARADRSHREERMVGVERRSIGRSISRTRQCSSRSL